MGMSRLYIFLLAGVGLVISTVGAIFSIVGLTHLFSGAPISVGIMAASLEAAKLVVAGFLYRYWGHINRLMRVYLSTSVIILSAITSLGIFGYLSHAYQKSSVATKTVQLKIAALRVEDSEIHGQINRTEKFIDSVPRSRISKKFALYESSRAQIRKLNQHSFQIQDEINKLKLELMSTQAEIGPLADVSETLGVNVDTVAKVLILIFVSVFDPLAICLVFAWGLAVRLREKYRGNEYRIASLAISKPVDHRYKKSA
jgi:hypothetical protein